MCFCRDGVRVSRPGTTVKNAQVPYIFYETYAGAFLNIGIGVEKGLRPYNLEGIGA